MAKLKPHRTRKMTTEPHFMPNRRVLILLLCLTVLRLLFAADISFLEDEAYYRLWGLYPAYAYFDHAPMTGWWIAFGQMLFGDTHIGLRFLSPVAGLVGSLVLWRIAALALHLAQGAQHADDYSAAGAADGGRHHQHDLDTPVDRSLRVLGVFQTMESETYRG